MKCPICDTRMTTDPGDTEPHCPDCGWPQVTGEWMMDDPYKEQS